MYLETDEDRISNLLQKVCLGNDGQVFITDTNEERLREHLEQLDVTYDVISL